MKSITFKIRLATEEDFNNIFRMSLLLNFPSIDELRIDKDIKEATKNHFLWVAQIENKVAGYISCQLFDAAHKYFHDSVFITELFVDKKYRKMGIGKELIRTVLKNNFPENYKYFSLTHDPNEPGLSHYYESFGFKEIGITKEGNTMMIKER